ncbi:vacuolar fusion protein MON1, putative [Plasmodium knowlesi strain H]|uniref:Vacuolar fusion protein MON1, putative n=3 Tax=Plasmodium knowlesi TaxID=5850 RepID=A0A5K1VLX2_PLAKH|nr:vacuolar fusion protein MON1, putative [Plasmodium knowlesi strain H]OTN66140.1 putative Vacuolar fusion protein MON1 [Plasmodium knowlesi]CAA9989807.1 vacuolar fusion protein MON1, putative [Plasmodium knowlesi strain H]SBO24350.1 vacuolar fusion protein MON1, putative [Plasmodium knowlesi strain H]SBO26696.1 vacuolar fusion protein MON1, putative [Plasmodium knowlesi strain H]VVS79281.1 vacuolar fusion protein MON1, putative [Plasmodium knowlesi strain H]|eukprot:XP_002259821.1 hypothetical protein, conserved in Plasmodium species [Plasmodium knowlesi strain H]
MEITSDEEGNSTNGKINKSPSKCANISGVSSESIFGARKSSDDRDGDYNGGDCYGDIAYDPPVGGSPHGTISEGVSFYDAKSINGEKGHSEMKFNSEEEEHAEDQLKGNINEGGLLHCDEINNSYTDEELEKFFEDEENELDAMKNKSAHLMQGHRVVDNSVSIKGGTWLPTGHDNHLDEKGNSNFLWDEECKNLCSNEDLPPSVHGEEGGMKPFEEDKEEGSETSSHSNIIVNKSYERHFTLGTKKLTINTDVTDTKDLGTEKNDDLSFMSNSSHSSAKLNLVEEEKQEESSGSNKNGKMKEEKIKREDAETNSVEGQTSKNENFQGDELGSAQEDDITSMNEDKVKEERANLCEAKKEGEEKDEVGNEKLNKLDSVHYFEKKESQESGNNSKYLFKKKKIHEDQSTPLWYKHKRHFFIFTYSGKPVFTRYGNEENLTSFYGTLLAIISKVESFSFSDYSTDTKVNKRCTGMYRKNSLKYIICKNTKVVYLDKEVLCLVCISKANESTNYILKILNYMYFQIISLLTKSIEKSFQIKPSFDVRYLLDGSDILMCNLISSCSRNMYSIFDGFEPLPLKQDYRNKIHNLISSFKINNVLLSFLIVHDKIIGISVSKYAIHSMDIIILINMITSMKSFKNAESWTPICLPIYNPSLFLYAYINYIRKKICCVYICSHASPRDFFHLSRHTSMIETVLISSGCYDEIVKASDNSPFTLPEIPGIDIIHVCYYIPYLKQYYSSKISVDKVKRILRVYQKCDDILRDSKLPAQIYLEAEYEKFYCIKTNLYHLYLSVPFHVEVNDDNINEILKVISAHHKEIFINNIKQITS